MIRILHIQYSFGPTPSTPIPAIGADVEVVEEEAFGVLEVAFRNLWERTHEVFNEEGNGLPERTFFPKKNISSARAQIEAFGELVLAIGNFAGEDLDYLEIEQGAERTKGVVKMAYDCQESVDRSTQLAVLLLNRQIAFAKKSIADGSKMGGNPELVLRKTVSYIRDRCLDLGSVRMRWMARQLGIPVFRVDRHAKFLQLGTGRYRNRFLYTNNDTTSFVATKVSTNKAVANRLMDRAGLPVSRQRVVTTSEEAVLRANELGFPVVVKPRGLGKGQGVSLDLTSDDQVRRAFNEAVLLERFVIVERMIEGIDYRMLVANGELIAVAERTPAQVVGDGRHTIRELIEIENEQSKRSTRYGPNPLQLSLDETARFLLQNKGYTAETVLADGETAFLREVANCSQGGSALDILDQVHLDNRKLAIDATTLLGLDVGGVDLISPDISKSWKEVECGILEVNTSPGLRVHWLGEREHGETERRLIQSYFPQGEPCAVPSILIVGESSHVAECGKLLEEMLHCESVAVCRVDAAGLSILGKTISSTPLSNIFDMRTALSHPRIDVAILGQSIESIETEGLPIDCIDIVVLLETDLCNGGTSTFLAAHASDTVILADDSPAKEQVIATLNRSPHFTELHLFRGDANGRVNKAATLAATQALKMTQRNSRPLSD